MGGAWSLLPSDTTHATTATRLWAISGAPALGQVSHWLWGQDLGRSRHV